MAFILIGWGTPIIIMTINFLIELLILVTLLIQVTAWIYPAAIDLNAHSWENDHLTRKSSHVNRLPTIDLCIASYLIENNALIFDDSKESQVLRSRLIDQIVQMVTDRGNGVCFDIQKVPVHYKSNYIDLIKSVDIMLNGSLVDRSLSDSAKRYEITVVFT